VRVGRQIGELSRRLWLLRSSNAGYSCVMKADSLSGENSPLPDGQEQGTPTPAGLDVAHMLDNAVEAAALLKALSHETRLVILCLLIDGKKTVRELELKLKLRQPVVSQQLARLRADELVETRRDGKNVVYSIARPEITTIISAIYRTFCLR